MPTQDSIVLSYYTRYIQYKEEHLFGFMGYRVDAVSQCMVVA